MNDADTLRRRRLVAIMAADAVDYSRLMRRDEDAGMAILMQRRQLLESEIQRHRGRVFSGAGDSMLAEFTSAVDSVRCALASQRVLNAANAEDPADRRLSFRIGINLGDVFAADDGNLYGDCVNLASRLESVAKPGGICLSEEAYRQVRNYGDFHFDDLGPVALKNLGQVRVYRVAEGDIALPAIPEAAVQTTNWTRPRPGISLVVLPFDNLSGDPDQEYFCDGLVNDITTDLSRFPDLLVISANSAFAYKDKHRKIQEIATELDVRYLLEGSVQRQASAGPRQRAADRQHHEAIMSGPTASNARTGICSSCRTKSSSALWVPCPVACATSRASAPCTRIRSRSAPMRPICAAPISIRPRPRTRCADCRAQFELATQLDPELRPRLGLPCLSFRAALDRRLGR